MCAEHVRPDQAFRAPDRRSMENLEFCFELTLQSRNLPREIDV
jgi:hypothetical protein